MAVPAAPERLTEMNIETATTRPKDTVPCHTRAEDTDHDAAHGADDRRRLDLAQQGLPPARELHVAGGETAHDHRHRLQPVLPEIAWMTGMNEAKEDQRDWSVAS